MMKGNEAIGEAAIRAGCRYFYGYPITPQSELPEYLSQHMLAAGGVYLQAESEVAAINMVYGAAATGVRVMTSSSGPGMSLKQEGISYITGAELPCLIVSVMRGGPGLGNIAPSQGDYYQATRGGGHGDYRTIVLAPYSVQEAAQLVVEGFDLADKYRNPVMVLTDGTLAQMMEPVDFDTLPKAEPVSKPWAVSGKNGGPKRSITSLCLDTKKAEEYNRSLAAKYREITENEIRYESYRAEDADILVVAYGIVGRMANAAVDMVRAEGIRAGMFRPISLWPFPYQQLNDAAKTAGRVLTMEMSLGQMVEDVQLAIKCRLPVDFYGRPGGVVPTVPEMYRQIKQSNVMLSEKGV
jgi:2-oxoglutarate ferredoxin oxidoreductase subunit alpha